MELQTFSASVSELYESAENADPNLFPREAVRIIHNLVYFDSAVLGSRCAAITVKGNPDCQDRAHRDMLLDHYDLRRLLLWSDAPLGASSTRWLLLYRDIEEEFTESDRAALQAIWPHVTRSININLNAALERINPDCEQRPMALINPRGVIEVANSALNELIKLEWPLFNERNLPLPVISALLNNGTYRGRQIEISASPKFGYLACTAKSVPLIAVLAPSELNVASRFAKGMTHSQIAMQLHVSPHTVRNQLAQVYQKLGVHSKIELMRAMSGR